MKNLSRIIFVLFFILNLFSCSSEKQNKDEQTTTQSELPPSLQGKNKGAFYVRLSAKEQNELKIKTSLVNSNFVDYPVAAPGVVFSAPNHASVISTPINGQVSFISKYEGARVLKGEELFTIQSLEFGNLVSEYLQAFAEEDFQTNRLERIKQLVKETISSASELEKVKSDYERARVSAKAAYSKLKAIGVSDKEIHSFVETDNINPVLKIKSPINGIIEQNFVELGQSVRALENMSRVLDTREVLIRGYLSPDDARLISAGDSVTVSKRENNLQIAKTIVASLNPGLDEGSRSVIVNILLPTKNGWPKPGENVRLDIITSSKKEVIAVPVEALTYDGNQAIVFVNESKGVFEKRNITVSEIRDKIVFVSAGLKSGENIAISNVFSLKALSRFDILSEE